MLFSLVNAMIFQYFLLFMGYLIAYATPIIIETVYDPRLIS